MAEKLAKSKSATRRGDQFPLTDEAIQEMLPRVPKWDLVDEHGIKKLRRTFIFSDFAQALEFTNAVGEIAEAQGHHPIITLTWGRTVVTYYTHKIKGLRQNDFMMAARTDELYSGH